MDQREQYSDENPVDGYSTGGDAETIQLDAVEPKKKRGASGGGANDQAGQDIGGTVRDTVQQVQETASNVAGQAQDTVGRVADQVRQTASTRLEDQKNRAVEGIAHVADTVREMSLSMQDQGAVSEYMDRAAWQLQKVADYLQEKDLRDLAIEVEHFARRQPTMFLAGGFLLGLLGARFLKSSARQLQAQEYTGAQGSSYQPQLAHFTAQGDYRVEGRADETFAATDIPALGDGDTFRSTYAVTPRDGNGSEG